MQRTDGTVTESVVDVSHAYPAAVTPVGGGIKWGVKVYFWEGFETPQDPTQHCRSQPALVERMTLNPLPEFDLFLEKNKQLF